MDVTTTTATAAAAVDSAQQILAFLELEGDTTAHVFPLRGKTPALTEGETWLLNPEPSEDGTVKAVVSTRNPDPADWHRRNADGYGLILDRRWLIVDCDNWDNLPTEVKEAVLAHPTWTARTPGGPRKARFIYRNPDPGRPEGKTDSPPGPETSESAAASTSPDPAAPTRTGNPTPGQPHLPHRSAPRPDRLAAARRRGPVKARRWCTCGGL